jgi:hypothetical protein
MAKKNNEWIMWVIIIIVVLIMFKADWTKPDISQFVEKEKSSTSLGDNLGDGVAINTYGSLCAQVPFATKSVCELGGGTWVCTSSEVGCYNFNRFLSCDFPEVQSLLNKCREIGAQASCIDSSISCKY